MNLRNCSIIKGGVKIVIASIWWREILEDIKSLGITDLDMEIFQIGMMPVLSGGIEEALDRRTIDLGNFCLPRRLFVVRN